MAHPIDIERNPKHHDFVYPPADGLPAVLRDQYGYMYAGTRADHVAVLAPEREYVPAVLRVVRP